MEMQLSKGCLQKLKKCNKYHWNSVLPNAKKLEFVGYIRQLG